MQAARPGKISIRSKQRIIHLHHLPAYAFFIRLQHFAGAFVKLDAVAVVGNMAARDHDGRDFIFKPVQGHRRRRYLPAIHRAISHVLRRAANRFHHAARAGPEISAHRHALARAFDFANGFKVLEKTLRVRVTNLVRHRRGQPARAARAKRHAAARRGFLYRNLNRQNHCAVASFAFSA